MKKTTTLIILASLIMLAILAILAIYLRPTINKQLSPIFPQSGNQPVTKRVVGFLPYWQLGSVPSLRFELLTEVIFFGIHTDEEGLLSEKDLARLSSSSFQDLKAALLGKKTGLSIAIILQENEKIEKFLTNKTSQKALAENVSALIAQNPELSGINLDFEYSGIPGRETVTGYTNFVIQFVNELKTHNPSLTVSVDITADAMRKSRLYDVEKLAKHVDFVVLMGYDFYRPTSDVAGPVAPLTGKDIYEHDVATAVSDFLTVVPKEKLILGVPYYGWDFPTVDDKKGSFVEDRAEEQVALSTYKRNRRLIDEEEVALKLDEESQTPWMVYREGETGGIRQIWFEDEASLGKKYDLVNEKNLAGIAIWALGYDGDYPQLWRLLEGKFKK